MRFRLAWRYTHFEATGSQREAEASLHRQRLMSLGEVKCESLHHAGEHQEELHLRQLFSHAYSPTWEYKSISIRPSIHLHQYTSIHPFPSIHLYPSITSIPTLMIFKGGLRVVSLCNWHLLQSSSDIFDCRYVPNDKHYALTLWTMYSSV